MKKILFFLWFIYIFFIIVFTVKSEVKSINPYIDSLNPKQNAVNVLRNTNIKVYFSQNMSASTITSNNIRVYGMQKGLINCAVNYISSSKVAVITPQTVVFKPGEIISVTLTSGIKNESNNSINPFVYNFTCAVNQGPGTFVQLSTVNTGSAPESAATGDFNSDNFIDISVPNLNSSSVSILKNNGSGYLNNSQTLGVGNAPRLTVNGDFDMDGDLDIIVINNVSSNMNILANNGSGNFSIVGTMDILGGPFSVVTGDFDGDGDLDIATANYLGNNVSVFKNNGSGGFSYPDVYSVGTGPVCIATGDINKDGNLDLAIAEWNINRVSVLLNNGNASFTSLSTHYVGSHPHSIALDDINGDLNVDIIVGNNASNYFSVLFNDGSGLFNTHTEIPVGLGTVSAITGDIDGDGDLDIAVSNNEKGVSIYNNNGSGLFSLVTSTGIVTGPRRISFSDFSGDGVLDIAVPNTDFNNVIILRNSYAAPQAPVLVSPSNGAIGVSLIPTFIWYGINNIINYKIQISTSSGFSNIIDSATVLTNQYSIQPGKLSNAVTYYWRVNATNSVGTSLWSNIWSFSTVSIPPAPVLISPYNNSIGVSLTPTLYWNVLQGISNYTVQISDNTEFSSLIDSANLTNCYYQIPFGKLHIGNKYYWRVNATNSYGSGPWSSVWNFTTWSTGVKMINEEIPKDYKLYTNFPNPFNPETHIRLDIPELTFTTLAVYDNIGRIVSTLINRQLGPGIYEVIWDGSSFSSGIYYYKINTDKFSEVKRMVLIK